MNPLDLPLRATEPSKRQAREEQLLFKVENFIIEQELLAPGEEILVAVSGGPDSVALLGILSDLSTRWGWQLTVAHVNHGLRGDESQMDLEFVRDLAIQIGVNFLHRTIPKGALGMRGRSLQEEAREARYRLLEEMRVECGASVIAVGHHAGDQAETVLAALGRGAGTQGLGGMWPRRGRIVRPLLCLDREEIISYLEMNGLSYRNDPSNENRRYLRVRIRKDVLPSLRASVNPSIVKALCRTAQICQIEDEYMSGQVEKIWTKAADVSPEGVRVSGQRYRSLHKAVRFRLLRKAYGLVSGSVKGLEHVHVEAMDRMAMNPGREKQFRLPLGVRFIVSMGDLLFEEDRGTSQRFFCHGAEIPGVLEIPEVGVRIRWEVSDTMSSLRETGGANQAVMDLDKVKSPVLVRSPRPGDRLRPKGLGGTKKIQDLLVDARVPRRNRWMVPVVEDANGIIWVAGYRIDERVAPGSESKRFLIAKIERI